MTTKQELIDWLKTSTARRVVLVEVDGVNDIRTRTNLFTYTEELDNAAWSKTAVTTPVASNNSILSPTGTLTADKLVPTNTASTTRNVVQGISVTSGKRYTLSLYAKAAELSKIGLMFGAGFSATQRYAWFDLSIGVLGESQAGLTTSIVSVGNGWYRCSISNAASSNSALSTIGTYLTNGGFLDSIAGNGVNGIYVWGLQVEETTSTIPNAYQIVQSATNFSTNFGTQYFSNKPYGTTALDTPASTIYNACINGGVTFSETIDLNGKATIGYGDIQLNNTGGVLDNLLNYIWTNKSVRVYIGDASWTKQDFYQIFSGYIADIDSKNRNSINLILVDQLQLLNTSVTETTIETVNPSATNKDQLLPVCLGECFNVTPVVVDSANLVYQVHTGPAGFTSIEDILEVRDMGQIVPINTDYGNGRFSLQRTPVGQITASVQGGKFGSPLTYSNKIGETIKNLLVYYGKKVDVSKINFGTFDTDPSTSAETGIYLQSRENVLDVCQKLANSVGAYLVTGLDGTFKLTQLKADYTSGETWNVTGQDMLERSLTISQKLPVEGAVKLNYCKNWTPQVNNLGTGLKPEVAAIFGKDWYSTVATDDVVLTNYQQSKEPVAKDTYLITTSEASAESSRLLSIYKKPRFVYTSTYYSHMLLCELGDILKITYPRFGLDSGKYGTAIQINRDWLQGRVTIGVLV